ncbi:MAG: hypothetical protein QCH31_07185 [Methanolobus sp.]|nr:hypothetical protein [Methanolobus sp.]
MTYTMYLYRLARDPILERSQEHPSGVVVHYPMAFRNGNHVGNDYLHISKRTFIRRLAFLIRSQEHPSKEPGTS